MGASSKAEVMKRYVEAWERNDWEAATAIWADNVIHHVLGRGPLAGDFHDKQAFLDHYGQVFAELGGTIEVVEFHDVLSQRGPCRRPSQRAGGAGGAEPRVQPRRGVPPTRRQDCANVVAGLRPVCVRRVLVLESQSLSLSLFHRTSRKVWHSQKSARRGRSQSNLREHLLGFPRLGASLSDGSRSPSQGCL
jgi:hypothetical protein